MPELYIITCDNGAGKWPVGADYLPSSIRQGCTIFDGDKLFMDKQRELWKKQGDGVLKKPLPPAPVNDTGLLTLD